MDEVKLVRKGFEIKIRRDEKAENKHVKRGLKGLLGLDAGTDFYGMISGTNSRWIKPNEVPMTFVKRFFLLITLLCLFTAPKISLGQTPAQVAAQFSQSATNDFGTVSTFINSQFAPNLGLFSTLGWDTPPNIFQITNVIGPKFSLGVGVGADFFKIADTPLNLSVLNNDPDASNPGQQLNQSLKNVGLPGLPIPFPFATLRIGLIDGLDIGFRYTELPNISASSSSFNVAAKYTGYGFDLRYKLLATHGLPDLTMGIHWNTLNGSIALGGSANETDPDYQGYTAVVNGTATYTESWNINDFGPEVQLGYNLAGILYPYIGVGFERYSGRVTSTMSGTVNAQLTNNTIPAETASTNIPLSLANGQPPTVIEPKYTVGLDIGSFWTTVFETNGTIIAGDTSFRIQI